MMKKILISLLVLPALLTASESSVFRHALRDYRKASSEQGKNGAALRVFNMLHKRCTKGLSEDIIEVRPAVKDVFLYVPLVTDISCEERKWLCARITPEELNDVTRRAIPEIVTHVKKKITRGSELKPEDAKDLIWKELGRWNKDWHIWNCIYVAKRAADGVTWHYQRTHFPLTVDDVHISIKPNAGVLDVGGLCLTSLAGIERLPKVSTITTQHVDAGYNFLTTDALRMLPTLTQLRKLDLTASGFELTEDNFPTLPQLTTLILYGNKVPVVAPGMLKLPALTALDLGECGLSSVEQGAFDQCPKLKKLSGLLTANPIGDRAKKDADVDVKKYYIAALRALCHLSDNVEVS